MAPSPALQTTGKWPDTLKGRCVALLIDDGSDAAQLTSLRAALAAAGATVKVIAPRIGGARLSDRRLQAADGQLAGSPSVLFDAVALLLAEPAGKALAKEAAALDFVRDAFGHLKVIAVAPGARPLFAAAGIEADAFVVDADDATAFVRVSSQRAWAREPGLRTLP